MLFGGEAITALFVSEPDVIALGAAGLRITSCFYIMLGVIYVVRGVLNGVGDAFFALFNGIMRQGGRSSLQLGEDYYMREDFLDEELFDKIEADNIEGQSDKKALKSKKILKAIKIALYAIMGETGARLFYKSSNEKSKNTDYIDRF